MTAIVTGDLTIAIAGHVLPITDADVVRFFAKVDKIEGGCWVWMAGLIRDGYGQFWLGGRMVYAHRFAYALAGNDLDPALQLDHLCHVRECVNPIHIRQVTHAENMANRAGAQFNNQSSGVRGVHWDRQKGRWRAHAQLHGCYHHGGLHDSIESAELAAINLRIRLGMANAADLARLGELGT